MRFRLTYLILALSLVIISCDSQNNKSQLIIFHAGSLSVPFKDITTEFNKQHPEIEIISEAAGSRQCARKITDLHRKCDIMASADYKVIDNLLIPEYASWNIKFAGNEMAVVFHDKSRLKDSINTENWYHILQKPEVIYGRSNPDFDPCGYRTVLTCKLAEDVYNIPGLSETLLQKDNNYIRPKEVDLIGLLETDVIDYLFLYKSVAIQHKLDYIVLPDSINLKNPKLDEFYATATVDISGKKPGETITRKGEAMIYGVTIPNNAPNTDNAIMFMEFLLSKNEGVKIMEANGQNSLVPSLSITYENIPGLLKKYALDK